MGRSGIQPVWPIVPSDTGTPEEWPGGRSHRNPLARDRVGRGECAGVSEIPVWAAIAYTLIETAKLNGLDPQAWLADVLHRIPEHPSNRIDELLPGNCKPHRALSQAARLCKGAFVAR